MTQQSGQPPGGTGNVGQLPTANARPPRRTMRERVDKVPEHWDWFQGLYLDIILGATALFVIALLVRSFGGSESKQFFVNFVIGWSWWWLRTRDWYWAAVSAVLIAASIAVIIDNIGGLPATPYEIIGLVAFGFFILWLAVAILRGRRS